ncbi:MAG: ribokinase [Oscillospiraceae bacterium]|nr:ribokinase [Oscillospiraceae bacterium]
MRVLNFGSLNLDYVYQVDHFVRPGETLSSSSQTVNPGGKGLNQSIALARAGAETWHAGCVGADGGRLRSLLEENGVNTEFLRTVDALQGNAVIQVAPSGENCILLFGGSNQCVTEDQIDGTLAAFGPGDYLVLQNEMNNLPHMVDRAYKRGLQIVLNPSPFDEKLKAVDFGKLSWVLMNEVEAGQLSGSEDPERAWTLLHERFPRLSVLITLGSEGSAAFRVTDSGAETARQAAFPVRAVDTTAAGDTYTGYFIGGLIEDLPLAECMRRASMASAISVTRPGAAPSIPTRDEVAAAL